MITCGLLQKGCERVVAVLGLLVVVCTVLVVVCGFCLEGTLVSGKFFAEKIMVALVLFELDFLEVDLLLQIFCFLDEAFIFGAAKQVTLH